MNSRIGIDIICSVAEKNGLTISETKNICYSQFSLLKKMFTDGTYSYDDFGNVIESKFNVIKLFGFGTFYVPQSKINMVGLIKYRARLKRERCNNN